MPKAAPWALADRARTRWLRAAQHADARGKALACIGYYAGLRRGEAVALYPGVVRISAREGVLIVRYGKGGKYREVSLHPNQRTALEDWIGEHATWPRREGEPGAVPQPARRRTAHPREDMVTVAGRDCERGGQAARD